MRRRTLAAATVWALGCATGCVSSVPIDPEASVRIDPPPDGFRVETFVVSATEPVDSDGNGLADSLTVVGYLFGRTEQYPLPVWAEGRLRFRLVDPGAASSEAVAEWSFTAAESRSARQLTQVGPAFMVDLSVLDARGPTGDAFSPRTLELVAVFEPSDASIGSATTTRTVRFPGSPGRRR